MRSASFAGRSCSVALLILAALSLAGQTPGFPGGPSLTVAPTITATVPAADATNVSLAAVIIVNFSENMSDTTVSHQMLPVAALTPSWPAPNVLHLTPAPALANCTVYTIVVRGNDSDENLPLVGDGIPNPWSFKTACDRPYILSTSPADGEGNVLPDADLVIRFSEPLDCLTVQIMFVPSLLPPASYDVFCLDETATAILKDGTRFRTNTTYAATATGQSNDTHDDLVAAMNCAPCAVPNPWTFGVNGRPIVSAPTLSVTGCLDAGTLLDVSWSMADPEDTPTDLLVHITFLNASVRETIFGPASGFPASASFGWTIPEGDLNTTVRVEVTDSAGASTWNESEEFRIDLGPPNVVSTNPLPDATGVSTNAQITIAFSEPMNRTAVELAISADPPFAGPPVFLWQPGDRAVTVRPFALPYERTIAVTVGRTAVDTCAPGRPMTSDYVFRFTTVSPNPSTPRGLSSPSYGETTVTLRWTAVTTYVTGDLIVAPDVVRYRVFRGNATDPGEEIADTAETEITDRDLTPRTPYWYRVQAYVGTRNSGMTATLQVSTLAPFLDRTEGRLSIAVAMVAVASGAGAGAIVRYRRKRREAEVALEDEIEEIVGLVRRVRTERDPAKRRKQEAALQAHFRALVQGGDEGDASFRADPRLDGLYRALARALVRSPEVDIASGRMAVAARLKELIPRLKEQGAAYRLLSEAEASVQSDLFPSLPESARKALLLVYFYGLEEYLNNRLRGLIPAGATILLGERGHINVRRRGWEAQWAGLTLGNLLFAMEHNEHFFVADAERWGKEVVPLLRQAVEARNRTAHPSREAAALGDVQDLVYRAIPAVESVLKWPKGPAAA